MRLKHTSLCVAALATTALTGLVATAGSALAVPPANGKVDVLAAVGSDTTQNFMDGFASRWNANTTVNKDGDRIINVAAFPTGNVTVPANGACTTDRTYGPANPPPAGSGAGRKALYGTDGNPDNANNLTTGCLDIARSSGARDTTVDPSTANFYAYAKDAVSWAYWGTSSGNLTQTDLQNIYTCKVTRWQDIAGSQKKGVILRYLPQSGSGTRDFFTKTILGGVTVAPSSTSCPLNDTIEENDGTQIPTTLRARAILPYSVGQWVSQNKAGGAKDLSAGNKLGGINGVKGALGDGTTAKPNQAAILDGSFLGSRYLFNVLDTREPQFASAVRAVGVDFTGNGLLCNGSQGTAISSAGFVPLPKAAASATVSTQSFCRIF